MELILPAIVSFFATLVSAPVVILLAKKFKLMDNPILRPHPAHVQKRVVPRAGGLAIFIGIAVTILLLLPLEPYLWGLLGGMLILLVVGLIDDKISNFSPYLRLLAQIASAMAVVASGVGIFFVTHPFGGIIKFDIQYLPGLLAILWIVWVMNMLNWSKGVDGQMPGVALVASLILGILSFKFFLQGDAGQLAVAQLSLISASSALAFLLVNWYPAKIFPGFSGSNILGLLIASLAILSGAKLATAFLVLLMPAMDFIYTFWRRIASGHSPVWGDRGHLHHHLLDLGFSHRQISLFYISLSVILGIAALTLDSRGKFFAAGVVGVVFLGGILWLNLFGGLLKKRDPDSG